MNKRSFIILVVCVNFLCISNLFCLGIDCREYQFKNGQYKTIILLLDEKNFSTRQYKIIDGRINPAVIVQEVDQVHVEHAYSKVVPAPLIRLLKRYYEHAMTYSRYVYLIGGKSGKLDHEYSTFSYTRDFNHYTSPVIMHEGNWQQAHNFIQRCVDEEYMAIEKWKYEKIIIVSGKIILLMGIICLCNDIWHWMKNKKWRHQKFV